MSYTYSEDGLIEAATQDVLEELGWEVVTAWRKETFGPSGLLGRADKTEVVLVRYLRAALERLNPNLPNSAYRDAVDAITEQPAGKLPAQTNYEKYRLLKDGVEVSYAKPNGDTVRAKLRVFDFDDYASNHFLAVRQLEVQGPLYQKRPDVIGFVNGVPLVFFELKAHHKDLRNAFDDNLTDYKDTIPHVFYHNAFIVLSNGVDARVGTLTSPYKYFLEWKRIREAEEGAVSLDTMLRGTCDPARLMDLFENFLLFDRSGGDIVKLMAKNHQYLGVNRVIDNVRDIEDLQGKLGVFWHTQGSGKSYSMVFLCEKIHRKLGGAYTFLLVVDRTELENQLYDTFSGVGAVTNKQVVAGKKAGISGREHLRELLSENHRYVFSLIHKFSVDPDKESVFPLITERRNVIVISDEAHRTQGGTYARNMRFHGLPNASYLGFTGTPLIEDEIEFTKNIFGDYVSVYDFKRAIDDEATLPLRYINRGEKLGIDNPALDERMAEILEREDLDDDQRRRLSYDFQRNYPVLTAAPRLEAIARDLVWHFNERGYQGKAMYVAMDKPTAVRMYDYIVRFWPAYLADLDQRIERAADIQEAQDLRRKRERVVETEICVVVSSEQNEVDKFRKLGLDIATHREKLTERDLEKQFKDPDHPFRLAIVCAMWITGFDAQCVSTVYLDKPIKGHTLMQTIARANRVYDDEKENGLIVDYGNVYRQLEKAYAVYGEKERGKGEDADKEDDTLTGKPTAPLADLAGKLAEAIQETKRHLSSLNFELDTLHAAKPMNRIALIRDGADAVCLNETSRTTFEMLARNVFRKYKALFPEPEVKPYTADHDAIDAIYRLLHQQERAADVTDIMLQLQAYVDESITVERTAPSKVEEVMVDLSSLNFKKLREAFAKHPHRQQLTYDLKQAIERKLKRMLRENPLRLDFHERYVQIVAEYNAGKSMEDTVRAFEQLSAFVESLSAEEQRAVAEELFPEELAIFDLLREGKQLSPDELKKVKKVAVELLGTLKDTKFVIEHWREKEEIKAQVKVVIGDSLLHLPVSSYTDADIGSRSASVYRHVYTSYYGSGESVYGGVGA